MTQGYRECNDMNSAFQKLRITSDESDRNSSNELDIMKPKISHAIDQIRQRKKRPDTDSIYDVIAHNCAININKELIEVVIEEIIAQNEMSNTQPPITCDNKILEPSEEEPSNFDKTSNTIINIQTQTLQKSLSYENLGTPEDIRNIREQFSVLKSHVICELSFLNQKTSSLFEHLEKDVSNMKVQNRKLNLLHENIKILQNELAQKNEIFKSLMEIQSTVFNTLSAGRNDQTISDHQQQQQQSQQLLEHNQQTMYEQHQQQMQ